MRVNSWSYARSSLSCVFSATMRGGILIDGGLFTRDFLMEGIRATTGWQALDNEAVDEFRTRAKSLLDSLAASEPERGADGRRSRLSAARGGRVAPSRRAAECLGQGAPRRSGRVALCRRGGEVRRGRARSVAALRPRPVRRRGEALGPSARPGGTRTQGRGGHAVLADADATCAASTTSPRAACAGVSLPTAGCGACISRARCRSPRTSSRSTSARCWRSMAANSTCSTAGRTSSATIASGATTCCVSSSSSSDAECFLPDEQGENFHQLALREGKRWEARVARNLSDTVFENVFPGSPKDSRSRTPPVRRCPTPATSPSCARAR